MLRSVPKKFLNLIPWLFLAIGFLVMFINVSATAAKTDRNFQTGLQNNSYLRTMTCIASVSPTLRTPDYVKSCYLAAEHANNNHIERYGDGR